MSLLLGGQTIQAKILGAFDRPKRGDDMRDFVHEGVVSYFVPLLCVGAEDIEFVAFCLRHFDPGCDERLHKIFCNLKETQVVGCALGHRLGAVNYE